MVFEAVVVELLNKFLKQYVENLDTSQLKIGIWGGDVVLNDLKIKSTLFDDLNLPVRVKWGKLGKLTMKIPWKNLYSSQVVVEIHGLMVVIIPNVEFKYDPVMEEKWALDRKRAKLRAIEEAKKQEVLQDPTKQKDSFVEKLLTQITKNLQVVIKNVHIRYEDKTTIPGFPFSVGVTLSNLSALSGSSDPTMNSSKLTPENQNFICKVVNLEGLAIYWNSGSALFADLPDNKLIDVMIETIPTATRKPDGYMYIFGPLSASAFLRLNPKPESDGSNFKIPKIFVNIHLKEIELAVSHNQFCDCMTYIKDFRRFLAANKYRKYRPVGIPVKGHAKQWWRFAYVAILEDITRRQREWSWEHIKQHRKNCRRYLELFKLKLKSKKLLPDDVNEFNLLEKKLDVFNLVLVREQVYVQVQRCEETPKASGSWFSGWFSYGTESKSDPSNQDELVRKINNVMTTDEKEKLYKAIGYEESSQTTNYPVGFVDIQFWFRLDELKATVYDDRLSYPETIMTSSVRSITMEFEKRSAASALKFVMILGKFDVRGIEKESYPELVTSNCKESESLIELLYETKPLNASCDYRVNVNARPLRIVYHAATINLVQEVFKTDSSDEMEKIVAATSASLPTFQRVTSLGLQYAIEKKSEVEVKVNIMSSYLIIPYGGVYRPEKEMLVLLLGKLSVETEESSGKNVSVKKLYLEGTTNDEIFSTVLSASYTKFKCNLTGVQVIFQLSGEDWVGASEMQKSPLQFLEPINVEVTIKKSLVMDDARIPKMIIEGKMPSLSLNIQEERFISFVGLVSSIASKAEKLGATSKKGISTSAWSVQSIGAQLENKLARMPFNLSESTEFVQGIDLVGHFEMNELTVNISKASGGFSRSPERIASAEGKKFLTLRIMKMEMDITSKTFEMIHLFKLGEIQFKHFYAKDWLPIVSTKGLDNDYLFVVEYIHVDTKIPDFFSSKGGIINRLTLNISSLNIFLEKEVILAQLEFATNVHRRVAENFGRTANAGKGNEVIIEEYTSNIPADKKVIAKGKKFRRKTFHKEVIDFFLQASLNEIDIVVHYKGEGLAQFNLKDCRIDLAMRVSYMTVDVNLHHIQLLDLNPITKHNKIITSLGQQTLSSRVTIYNKEYFGGENSLDMAVEAEFGGIHCTYVCLFFTRAFEFLSAFQSHIQSFKEGATIAAQKAKENVMKAFQNAAEIYVKISIIAPLFLVPKTSTSLEALAVDLGVLTVQNSITELDCTHEEGTARRPLVDTMKFHLQNLKMERCTLMEDTMAVANEKTFLVPVTFDLDLKRNLSWSWFKVIPQVEVLAQLATVRVTLSHEDLCGILNIIKENTKEGDQGQDKFQPDKSQLDVSQSLYRTKSLFKRKEQKVIDKQEFATGEDLINDSSNFFTLVKFMFFMDSFIFDAVNEDPETDGKQSGLARFVLDAISLKGRMFSNNSIYTSMMLGSCLLDDTRPGKEGRLTRLMERTLDSAEVESGTELNQTNSMIEVIYQKKDEDYFVDIRVYKFTLILSMDFLQKLGVFFTSEEMSTGNTVKPVSKTIDIQDLVGNPTFTVNVRLEKPDIIFVENMDSVNVDALIFHTEMVMKYRTVGSKQVISGALSDVELYSCCFNPAKRRNTLNQVIKPFAISMAGSTPAGSGLHIDICFSDIFISINPITVDLISKCYEALLKDSSISERSTTEKNYADLWDIKPLKDEDYWFLNAEVGQDALTFLKSSSFDGDFDGVKFEQICLLAIPSITILLEGEPATRAQPLILLEMGFQMHCYNWSEKLNVKSTLSLQMQYYNTRVSHWEPIIEPVEKYPKQINKPSSYVPWEIMCCITLGDEGELEELRPPKVQITLSCSEILQLTATKTGLDVLKSTVEKYTSAVKMHQVKKLTDLPPFSVRNETGLVVELLLDDSKLQVCRIHPEGYKVVRLDPNSEVDLQDAVISPELSRQPSLALHKETRLHVKFPMSPETVFQFSLAQSCKLFYPCPPGVFSRTDAWSLVCEVTIADSSTAVVLRSICTVINYFNETINIHYLSEDGKTAEYVGTVEGNSKLHLPFHAIYNVNKKLFFSLNGYSLSVEPFDLEKLMNESCVSHLLQCTSKLPENRDPFFIQAFGETEEIYSAITNRMRSGCTVYKIHLEPTVKILNSLPVPLVICFQGCAVEMNLSQGNTLQITNAEPGNTAITLRISDYLEKEWSCKEQILENPSEFLIWKFVSYNGLAPETLDLGVQVTCKRKTALYVIYCPYFMVNKTGHLLSYKFEHFPTVFYHPGNLNMPVMFSPTSKKFFSKKSAFLQFENSQWSDKFPVDVAGSGGTIECKDSDSGKIYKVSVNISLTYNSLTKIIIFTPFYVLCNSMEYAIECQDCGSPGDPWLELPPQSCTPFWPDCQVKENTLRVRPKGSKAVTPSFAYHSTDDCLLRLSHKYGGIFVNIKGTHSGNYITFTSYKDGLAPALIINHSKVPVVFHEIKSSVKVTLKPSERVMYSWLHPTGERKLILKGTNQRVTIALQEDTDGVLFNENDSRVRYVSFLDGPQRVLIFTEDQGITRSLSSVKSTNSGVELICKIQGVGLSLVNDVTRVDVLYLTFISSGITWQYRKFGKSHFKEFKGIDTKELENAYQKYEESVEANSDANPIATVNEKFKVNFQRMELLEPISRELRRTFEPGLRLIYRQIENQVMLNLKIYKIQVDSQLLDCVFPVVLAKVPPPQTVSAMASDPKPFFELSVVKVSSGKGGIEQYKYFKTLIQEFHVKMDIGFIEQIFRFLTPDEISVESEKINFKKDLEFMEQPLKSHVEMVASHEQKNFFDLLHFSPLKIHFSFSMAGKIEKIFLPPRMGVMLQSLGVTLTDVNDVVFRLSYLERKCVFYSNSELKKEVISHYYGQIVRQAYVLLLGLDVIGNPYGLIVGIGEGVEAFFYEPFQGMIQGPSEFGKGMALGWKSLFEHTVGSAAGTLGRITGSLGKGLAVLSLDKEYQMHRMLGQAQQVNIHSSMARGGRGMVMGVVEGFSGVVQKPIKGAKEDGVGGFFKGMGKGVMGLFTRPVTGIVDFASTSLNAVKRAVLLGSENKRLRPPRFFHDNCFIEPYNMREAQGHLIFYLICQRKYCETDKYEYHMYLREKEVVVLTNKRIILADFSEVFGSWQEHMAITWLSMPDRPRLHTKGVALTMPVKYGAPKKEVKVLLVDEQSCREDIYKKMVELYDLEKRGDSDVP